MTLQNGSRPEFVKCVGGMLFPNDLVQTNCTSGASGIRGTHEHDWGFQLSFDDLRRIATSATKHLKGINEG